MLVQRTSQPNRRVFSKKTLAWLLLVTSVCFVSLMGFAQGCGGDACSLTDASSCPNGQVCAQGTDGKLDCFVCATGTNKGCPSGQTCVANAQGVHSCIPCDVTTKMGCANGEVCLADMSGKPGCYCNTDTEAGCMTGTVCEDVTNGLPACFPPVTVSGQVFNLSTGAAIAGARVVARDANFAALSGVATTDAMGNYNLVVPVKRNPDGSLTMEEIFLRADAAGFQTFPTPPRVALPIDVSKATGMPLNLMTSATKIGMIPLQSTTGLGTVSGKVVTMAPRGTLVVAGGMANAGGGVTGIADTDGTYRVFNVPAGSVTVKGYKAGIQLNPATANVTAGAETMGVDLTDAGAATATVSGNIEIVNPGMGKETSVILAVDETFNPNAARGEAPPGLRAYPVTGAFSIPNVPDGNYVVLAAFENDFLVRDPDTSIAGTAIVHLTVKGASQSLSQSFKVTGALDVVSPDAEQVVMGTPSFVWADDSGEDHYDLVVFDAYGNKVWENAAVPGVSGSATVTAMYGGPPLTSGELYQFKATSIKKTGAPLSTTEDLRGVFLYK